MSLHSWYLKKEWVDREPGIEAVHLHYSCTLLDEQPDWDRPHPRWPMPGCARSGSGTTFFHRQHVLRMPFAVADREGRPHAHFLLHYYFEVFQAGRRWTTEAFRDEIVSRELDYVDWEGRLSGVALCWSVSDWSAPVWLPTEDPRFGAAFGEHHERRADQYYRSPDQSRFALEKWNLMKQLPLPWRWTGRIYAPKGAIVRQRWHIGNVSPAMAWEDWDPHPPEDFVHFL